MSGDLFLGTQTVTRAEFTKGAQLLASALVLKGLKADDVVTILMRNDVATLEVIEACRYLGLLYVSLNWHAAPKEVEHILEDSKAKLLFAHSDLLAGVASRIPDNVEVVNVTVPAPICEQYGVSNIDHQGVISFDDFKLGVSPFAGQPKKLRGLFAYTSGSTGRPKGIVWAQPEGGGDAFDVNRQLGRKFM